MNTYECHTDGACIKNRGHRIVKGGTADGEGKSAWAYVVVQNGVITQQDCNYIGITTNNRAELSAVIELLRYLTLHNIQNNILIYSDSKYVINGITKWMPGWINRGFNGVKNPELWQSLLSLTSGKNIEWRWERGHCGNKYNEIVDRLARESAEKHC
jgi:ribonuclease HI